MKVTDKKYMHGKMREKSDLITKSVLNINGGGYKVSLENAHQFVKAL